MTTWAAWRAKPRPAQHHLDGRVLLMGALTCILVTVLTPPGHWERLAGEAALVTAAHLMLAWNGTYKAGRFRHLVTRFAVLAPILLLGTLSLLLMPAVPGQPLPWERAATAAARALIGFGALAAALRSTGPPELLPAMARLRVPALIVTLMALMLRYLGLLEDEAARMMRARDLRGTPPSLRARARVAGWMVGSLFLRSVERSERVSVAMQARGFTGLLPPPPPRPLAVRDFLVLAALLLAQALLLGAA